MSSEKVGDVTDNAFSVSANYEASQTSRRNILTGAGAAIGAALVSGLANAADGPGHEHAHHAPRHTDALDAANQCSQMGRLCLAHCLVSFEEGDTSLATCARSVHNMLSLCDAFAAQIASNSRYIGGIATVCRSACADCEKECRKHEDDHVECKQCADACAKLVAAIDEMMS